MIAFISRSHFTYRDKCTESMTFEHEIQGLTFVYLTNNKWNYFRKSVDGWS